MNITTPTAPQPSTRFPIVRSRIPSRIATETRYMYDSETGRRIPTTVAHDNTDRFEDFNLEQAIRAATEYNIQTNRISAQHREYYLGEADVAGPMASEKQLDDIKSPPHTRLHAEASSIAPEIETQSHTVGSRPPVIPEVASNPIESKAIAFSSALLTGNFKHMGHMIQNEWTNWMTRFKSGEIESPSLMGRVRDLGVDEVKALGLSFVTTQAATMMVESAFVLAWTGPVSEKAVFLASGFAKFRALSSTNSIPLLVVGTLIMAAPNMIADIVFHDSIYTQLAEFGFSEGHSGLAVVPVSFLTALACAVVMQYGVYKGGYKLIERHVQRNSQTS